MGTNYYLHRNVCKCCNRSDDPQHIGKSSGGWTFALHVYPNEGIHDLPDWQREWETGQIRNEYGVDISPTDMVKIITERKWSTGIVRDPTFFAMNHAVPGPNNLVRHKIDKYHTIGHGKGTWDLCVGDFS